MLKVKNFLGFGIAVSVATVLVGCGGGGSSSDDTTSTTGTAYYEDSAIAGADYSCGAQSGVTGSDGSFTFEVGQGCEFKVGDIVLRGVSADELKNGARIVENTLPVAQFLQSIDVDGDPSNGINITSKVKTALKNAKINHVPTGDLANVVNMLKNSVEGFDGQYVSTQDALKHLMKNDELARATEQTKKLLANKTFYAPDVEDGVVEVSFNADVSTFTHPDDNGNSVDDITVMGNKIMWDDGSYAIIENKNSYILFTDYDNSGYKDSEHRLYTNQADAQKYYESFMNKVIPITEDMLSGKTFYDSHMEDEDSMIEYCKSSFSGGVIHAHCIGINNRTGEKKEFSGTGSYILEDGKIKETWKEDNGNIDKWIDILKVKTDTEWIFISENDWNNDGVIDESETHTQYLYKPSNFPAEL